ncbi:hypothetical protein CB1_001627001 [Camelus ferus]|nr:hypothetical protein CB1_001627001 [Camelus ferus]
MVGLSMMDVVRVVVHGDIASDEQIPNQIGDVDRQDSGLRARCPCLPQLGPENTMMSFEKAVEHGAFGLESDVHISYDHVPFLMHDLSLRRTTNIKEVLPNASLRHPSLFDWDFLSTLNAGKWFSHSRGVPKTGVGLLVSGARALGIIGEFWFTGGQEPGPRISDYRP